MDPIFAPIEDLSTLSDEELASKISEYRDLAKRLMAGEAELVGDRDDAAVIAEATAGADLIDSFVSEQGARADADTANKAALSDLAKRMGVDDAGDGDGDGDGDASADGDGDGDAATKDGEPAAVAASGAPRRRRAIPRPTGGANPDTRPGNVSGDGPGKDQYAVTASALDAKAGFAAGTQLDARGIALAIKQRKEGYGGRIFDDRGAKVPVVRLSSDYGDDRTLTGNVGENAEKIRAVTSPEAIAASGGICAPVTPYYGLLELSVPARPVKAALPSFNADRGGIRYAVPPSLADVSDAVGLITAANDARGGTFSQKSCQHVECPDLAEVDVSIIYHCVEFGNLQARTFPEQVAQFNELVLAAHARVAETNLLDGISGASTQVTAVEVAGATATLLGQMIIAAAGYRSRNRMGEDAPLRVLAPSWIVDAMQVDVLRSQFARFDSDQATFEGELRKRNITISWYLDSPTTASPSQIFAAQDDGVLITFPTHANWFLFAEGSFMFLDGGTLELGIVRDSVLNSTNDFQIFGETFENIAYLGIESLEVVSAFCANGQVIAPVAASGCAA